MSKPLRQLPKIELHRHLEGAVRLKTLREVGAQLGLELPVNENDLREKALVLRPMENLGVVLEKFWLTQSVLASEEILERVAFEACEDAYNEGIRILELRYAPSFIQINHPNLNFETIHGAIVNGIARGEKTYPIAVALIGIVVRVDDMKTAERTGDFIVDHKDSFAAIDLAGDEAVNETAMFSAIFMKAKKAGLRVTVHAGEADLAGSAGFVHDAIEQLGAERIGHGVQIHKHPATIEFVKHNGVALELCPTSNWLTNAVKALNTHPFRRLMDAGVLVTLNSDDPGIFGIDLTNEYGVLSRELGFTEAEFQALNRTAFDVSFVSMEKKRKVWSG